MAANADRRGRQHARRLTTCAHRRDSRRRSDTSCPIGAATPDHLELVSDAPLHLAEAVGKTREGLLVRAPPRRRRGWAAAAEPPALSGGDGSEAVAVKLQEVVC